MKPRFIGPFSCNPVGLGCMNLSHAYGNPPDEKSSIRLLNNALDMGYNMLDTAALYGFGANEQLVAKAVGHRRSDYLLASKCGMFKGADGKKEINGRPETIRRTCEDSLKRLNTDVIDLYYLHRWDKSVPIEESVGELSRLVDEGKIRQIGLSEVSSETLTKAHSTHAIAAVQSEYSLWTRHPEIAVLDKCIELGTAFVAFSPVGRGILTGNITDPTSFASNDIRHAMPRFNHEHFAHNLALVKKLELLVSPDIKKFDPANMITLATLALSWLLAKADNIHVIPGTTNLSHLQENIHAAQCSISPDLIAEMGNIINQNTVSGQRYNRATQLEIDTEEFA
ncbi:aldo/keto reductase [Vibrio sp. F74]|uniref:aldo/keto reductase n=1 Tax=Vibrio sp. F74 TaxID=700020 RepID=UPI0035F5E7DB